METTGKTMQMRLGLCLILSSYYFLYILIEEMPENTIPVSLLVQKVRKASQNEHRELYSVYIRIYSKACI